MVRQILCIANVYVIILIVLSACTDNPLFVDKKISDAKLKVSGKILLNNSTDHSGVFVWLEGLEASTYTDSSGYFTLQLPPPESLPGGSLAWTDSYKLYYYLANYKLDYSNVFIRSGEFVYGQEDINSDGNISKKITLLELLQIDIEVSPKNNIQFNYSQRFFFKVNLINKSLNNVNIKSYMDDRKISVIFKHIKEPFAKSVFVLNGLFEEETLSNGRAWDFYIEQSLWDGAYEVFPYIIITQSDVPQELLNSISPYINTFTSGYFDLPLKRNLQIINVLP